MRALIYADLQATDGHERCYADAAQPLQLARVRQFYAALLKVYEEQECGCLWDLGDTTDDRTYIPMTAIDEVLTGLAPFSYCDLNIKLIGNHEQFLRDTSKHIGRMFEAKFNVVAGTDIFEYGETLIVCAAFPSSDAALSEWLSATAYKYRNYARKLLLGHFQVAGCALNSGTAVTGISTAILHKYTLGLLGHVHRPQQIGNAYYVGSPFQQNFGEKGEAKRVGVLDLDTLELTWIPLEGFPEYRVVTYPQWTKQVKKGEEHRYQVVLKTPEEAKSFYAHPLMGCATPVYDYVLEAKTKAEALQPKLWTKSSVMQRYMEKVPPGSAGIQTSLDEVLAIGDLISKDE